MGEEWAGGGDHLTVSFPRHTMPWASVVLRSQTSFMRPEAVATSATTKVAMVIGVLGEMHKRLVTTRAISLFLKKT